MVGNEGFICLSDFEEILCACPAKRHEMCNLKDGRLPKASEAKFVVHQGFQFTEFDTALNPFALSTIGSSAWHSMLWCWNAQLHLVVIRFHFWSQCTVLLQESHGSQRSQPLLNLHSSLIWPANLICTQRASGSSVTISNGLPFKGSPVSQSSI